MKKSLKKCVLAIVVVLIFVMSGCGTSKTAQIEHDEDIMAELTAVCDLMEDGDAKDVVKKLMNAPVKINKSTFGIEDMYDSNDLFNIEVAPFDQSWRRYGIKPAVCIELSEYVRYYCSYSQEDRSGGVRVHYLTVMAHIQDDSLKQPLHVYAYDRVLEKSVGAAPQASVVWRNIFCHIGGKRQDGAHNIFSSDSTADVSGNGYDNHD